MTRSGAMFALWVVVASGARAQTTDRFDSPQLLQSDAPPGVWDGRFIPAARLPQSLAVSLDGGAHRGPGMLVIDDQHHGGGASNTQALLTLLDSGGGDRHLRFWFRAVPDGGTGAISLASIIGVTTFAEAVLEQTGPTLGVRLQCDNTLGQGRTGVVHAIDGGWHLLEVGALGVGLADGGCDFALDGVQTDTFPIDYSGSSYTVLSFGLAYAPDVLAGAYLYDDFGIGPTRPPARLEVSGPDGGDGSRCQPGLVRFVDSRGEARALLTNTRIGFVTAPSLSVFEPGCVQALSEVEVDAGANALAFAFRVSSPGSVTVAATADDLLGGSFDFVANLPDAGSADAGAGDGGELDGGARDGGAQDAGEAVSPEARTYAVGCGCGSGPLSVWAALMVLLWVAQRSAGRRA